MRRRGRTLLLTHQGGGAGLKERCRATGDVLLAGPEVESRYGIALSFARSSDLSALAGQRYDRVLLHGFGPGMRLPDPILRDIFSRSIGSIRHVAEGGLQRPYQPFATQTSGFRVLNVFPASPIPLDKGANQRAFNLTYHLNCSGITTDLLLTTGRVSALPRLAELLTAIAPTIHTYRNDKPMLSPWLRCRREVERARNLRHGKWRRPPDLFVDRLCTRAARDGADTLAKLVATNRYDAVIVNFAWMTGLLDAARASAPSHLRWICDTHDVQFVRGELQNSNAIRWQVNQAKEREAELTALAKYDAVLAISQADQTKFQEYLPYERVVLAPSGFDYALAELATPEEGRALTFGFIGRSMEANAKALEKLVKQWWPAIARKSPKSQLLVAGSICASAQTKSLLASEPNIRALGFVPTLASFYSQLDVCLNPVVVQGGLNFKSVEAVAAGCLLVTTPMGLACLGEGAPALAAESGTQVTEALQPFFESAPTLYKEQERAQAWYLQHFSDAVAFAGLRKLLND